MVNINLSTKNVGVFEAFYNSAKVIFLFSNSNFEYDDNNKIIIKADSVN
jgi:hypothetical protein